MHTTVRQSHNDGSGPPVPPEKTAHHNRSPSLSPTVAENAYVPIEGARAKLVGNWVVPEYECPECGAAFDSLWHVTVGESGGYKSVFGGPVALDMGRCNNCNIDFERTDGGSWRRQGGR